MLDNFFFFLFCDVLVVVMVGVFVLDQNLCMVELVVIECVVNYILVFVNYDIDCICVVFQMVMLLFEEEDGFDVFFGFICDSLFQCMFEIVYLLVCDVVVLDGCLGEVEFEMLVEICDELQIDCLYLVVIEFVVCVCYCVL